RPGSTRTVVGFAGCRCWAGVDHARHPAGRDPRGNARHRKIAARRGAAGRARESRAVWWSPPGGTLDVSAGVRNIVGQAPVEVSKPGRAVCGRRPGSAAVGGASDAWGARRSRWLEALLGGSREAIPRASALLSARPGAVGWLPHRECCPRRCVTLTICKKSHTPGYGY